MQYPVNLVLDGRRCLVVGGGKIALRKVEGLRETDPTVKRELDEIICDRPDMLPKRRSSGEVIKAATTSGLAPG